MNTFINIVPDQNTIVQAANRIKPYIHHTPVLTSSIINNIFNAELFFKCENFQKAGAFKSRGAVNTVFSLSDEQLKNGVCTHSSGNHAQALARAARLRNTKAYIVMPKNSPIVKVNAVKYYGGKITFCKPNLKAREDTLNIIISNTNATEVHPYNDNRIIAAQATAAKELIEETGFLDIIMTPVGGGGLLSGTALSVHYFSPKTKVIAAEPEKADDAFRSFYQRKLIPSKNPDTIADGLLTSLGTITFPIILKFVNEIVTVSENAIIESMKLVWERMKIIIEPSSAVPIAALLEKKIDPTNKKIGIILSGGNVDLEKLPWNK
ncbi:MAG: pyridoxal-phosphate dependent enzyme [Bacteroidales bacterium]|nr:pyridoxal-phosphate dependent enzyme [Bacteroidales bacterium]